MTVKVTKLEKDILNLVQKDVGNTLTLVSKLRISIPTISESVARQTVWRLVDRGQLCLTDVRTLAVRK